MLSVLHTWLTARGFDASTAAQLVTLLEIAGVILIAVIANFVAKKVVVSQIQRLSARTSMTWDDVLIKRGVFHRLSHLAPALVISQFSATVLADSPRAMHAVQQGCVLYVLLVGAWVLSGVLTSLEEILSTSPAGRGIPVKSFAQVGKIVLWCVVGIATVATVIGQSPVLLFSGLGAMTAVLLLVFKDPLLGFVGGIQLSANQMVAIGDWIQMPKYGADGDVIEVALTTVKVQNFDKTIVTIPTYSLISDSFKNWRGMKESGGRRIKRAINIDMTSVTFCDEEMLERFRRIQYVADYLAVKEAEIAAWNAEQGVDLSHPVNGRRLTNLGTFRAYVTAYLRHHPKVHQHLTLMVRHLDPTPDGLPVEIYLFSADQAWVNYEGIQADIFDHVLAVVPQFDLRVFQHPSGGDIRTAVSAIGPPQAG